MSGGLGETSYWYVMRNISSLPSLIKMGKRQMASSEGDEGNLTESESGLSSIVVVLT